MSESRKNDVQSAVVTLVLHDKGTRLGCELWRASGLILKTKHYDEPILVSVLFFSYFFKLKQRNNSSFYRS